jgi:HPt (histidine-containing phosphotransfer) domain-containing protein
MDVQMPEMDGYEATAAIRERDTRKGRHTPIVAMTAHAMNGDRERCLQAGMDGYVAKPLHAKQLLDAIEAVIPHTTPSKSLSYGQDNAQPTDPNEASLRIRKLLERLDGDQELLSELSQTFLESYPKQMSQLRKAIANRNPDAVKQVAHSLKGAVGVFYAQNAFNSAQRLEEMGNDRNLAEAELELERLEEELELLRPALTTLTG